MKIIKKILLFCWLSTCLIACANVVALEGGDQDVTPPKLDSLRSTRNFQTKFQQQPISLTFNEWIKFEDPSQVVVSPPLEKKPKIQLKGKTIKFQFDDAEVLRENATYTINFGESIKDITQGNKTKARFVFSTGEMIDSLQAKFNVFDAVTNAPIEDALVLLYENLQDSVVTKERPFYFAKTDKQGNCLIENVRKGSFKAFALSDANLNYKYDLPTEKIGFIAAPISVGSDSAQLNSIAFFDPQFPIRIKEKNTSAYGQAKFSFSRNALDVKPTWENVGQKVKLEYESDSLHVWYHQDTDTPWKLFVLKDTISIKISTKAAFLQKNKVKLQGALQSKRGFKKPAQSENIIFSKPLALKFNFPIATIDTSKIKIQDDTTKAFLPKITVVKDSLLLRKLSFNSSWLENRAYTFRAFPGAFTDMYGLQNDTIEVKLNIAPKKNFGDIIVKYSELSPDNQYIMQLLDNNNNFVAEHLIKGKEKGEHTFFTVQPSIYQIKIITDVNQNGRWDSGNYYEKRQPEPIFSKKLEELKPNWSLETEIEFN